MKEKAKHYTLTNILKCEADYNLIYGERSNGKTTAVLRYALESYCKSNYVNQLAIVRRWEEDFKGKNGDQLFQGVVDLGWVRELTDGEYNSIYYYSQRWYLCNYEDGKRVDKRDEPFAMGFALTKEEHYKSTSYPNIKTILFDEFITRGYYLPNEFISFQNLLSTIIRLRDDVKIFMCGNTVNKYGCLYYDEMGLTGIKKQKQGTIDIYTYGASNLRVAVEYSDMPSKKKASNKYFAFDNPKLKMITEGTWEMDIYPHLPMKYKPKDVVYKFFIEFNHERLQCNVIMIGNERFIYIHRKTTPIQAEDTELVYQEDVDVRRNYRTNIFKYFTKTEMLINEIIKQEKIFYQSNDIGEIMRNYLMWCKKN